MDQGTGWAGNLEIHLFSGKISERTPPVLDAQGKRKNIFDYFTQLFPLATYLILRI